MVGGNYFVLDIRADILIAINAALLLHVVLCFPLFIVYLIFS